MSDETENENGDGEDSLPSQYSRPPKDGDKQVIEIGDATLMSVGEAVGAFIHEAQKPAVAKIEADERLDTLAMNLADGSEKRAMRFATGVLMFVGLGIVAFFVTGKPEFAWKALSYIATFLGGMAVPVLASKMMSSRPLRDDE